MNATHTETKLEHLLAHGKLPVLAQVGVHLAYAFVTWGERRKTRAQLATLTPQMLDDIGLSAAQAQAEAEKPFWRP